MKKIFLILLLAGSCGLIWAQTNALTAKKAPVQLTDITSDSADFDLNTNRAVYRGHVVVNYPNINLKCEWLLIDIPAAGSGGSLSHVSAETNVVIDYTDEKGEKYHITSDKAVYNYKVVNAVTNQTVTFTGNPPRVETSDAIIVADEIVWNRGTGHFDFKNPHMTSKPNPNGSSSTNAPRMKLF